MVDVPIQISYRRVPKMLIKPTKTPVNFYSVSATKSPKPIQPNLQNCRQRDYRPRRRHITTHDPRILTTRQHIDSAHQLLPAKKANIDTATHNRTPDIQPQPLRSTRLSQLSLTHSPMPSAGVWSPRDPYLQIGLPKNF